MTPEEMQAEIDRLQQTIRDNERKVENAVGVQRAFKQVAGRDEEAAKYLLAISQGMDATAPWEKSTDAPALDAAPDPDLDTAAALKAQEERLMAAFEQRISQMSGLLDQKVNSTLQRTMGLESKSAISNVQQWFEQTYPSMDFGAYRAKAAEQAQGAEALLQTEQGLKTLLQAAVAPDLVEYGRSQAAEEKARVREMADSVFGGPVPGSARGGDEDDFADLDWDNDPDGAFLKAFEREGVHLQGH